MSERPELCYTVVLWIEDARRGRVDGAARGARALLRRVKDERLCFPPTVMPVAAVWGQGGKVGESIPTLTQ